MRVESPISDKSSVCFILTRARGLGILTFDKIKKIVFQHKNIQNKTKSSKYTIILSKQKHPPKNDVKKFFMEINISHNNYVPKMLRISHKQRKGDKRQQFIIIPFLFVYSKVFP
ncbi:MAG: hypothetical protein LUD00_00390 [Prevotellaceae bacterium]|nr:hypothetical protein [Prevotellaceae bacterium]